MNVKRYVDLVSRLCVFTVGYGPFEAHEPFIVIKVEHDAGDGGAGITVLTLRDVRRVWIHRNHALQALSC